MKKFIQEQQLLRNIQHNNGSQGFINVCKLLSEYQDESLNSLFGEDIQKEADLVLAEIEEEVIGKTKSLTAAHKKVFHAKDSKTKEVLKKSAQENSNKLAHRGFHRVECPSCKCTSTVIGEPYGKGTIENKEDEIIVRQSILPTKFNCTACELKLNGYNSLAAADIANHYTRRNNYSPEEYYDMINPEDYDSINEKYNEIKDYYEDGGWNNE